MKFLGHRQPVVYQLAVKTRSLFISILMCCNRLTAATTLRQAGNPAEHHSCRIPQSRIMGKSRFRNNLDCQWRQVEGKLLTPGRTFCDLRFRKNPARRRAFVHVPIISQPTRK